MKRLLCGILCLCLLWNGAWLAAFAEGALTVESPAKRSVFYHIKALRRRVPDKAAA